MCSLYLGENLISGSKPINLGVRNIGEIVSSSLPLTDAGLHLLDGSLILGGGIYQGFVDYIADLYAENPTANYFTTEALWQQSVTDYGVCGKFVYDSVNNTVRLPKVTGIIEGTTDVSALGDLVEAGLPNITGTIDWSNGGQGHTELGTANGAFAKVANTNVAYPKADDASSSARGFTIDASRSSSIYGNSSTVQPQTIKAFYYIVIANSTKTEIQVDIDEIATDLSGKADTDLTNATDQAKMLMGGMAMPSDTYINLTLGARGSSYTAPASGYIYFNKSTSASNQDITITVGNSDSTSDNYSVKSSNPVSGSRTIVFVPVKKGQTFWINYSTAGATNAFRFYYAVGSESEAS